MKKLLQKLYILGFMGLTVAFSVVIWNVTFGHLIHEYHTRHEMREFKEQHEGEKEKEKEKASFEKIILKSDERVKHYLGYKILETQRIKGHFHHIGFDIGPDNRSYCVSCHGDMPHDKVKDLRAFLNMHAFFISCQTCHAQINDEEKTGVYKWYDRETGDIVPSPAIGMLPGAYHAKILPFVNIDGKVSRIDTQERIDFASDYRLHEKELNEGQKSRAKKLIHKIVSKKPHLCEDCHQKENPLLPLADLGYPKERIDSITSTEVVGMIKKYTEFYMPKMLLPGEGEVKNP